MNTGLQLGMVQEALDQCHTYRQIAALRNGLPNPPPRNVVALVKDAPEAPTTAEQPPAPPAPPVPSGPVPPTATTPGGSTLSKVALAAALAAGGAGLGGLGYWAGTRGTAQKPPVTVPVPATNPPPAVDHNGTISTGDLLEYLRQRGYNLPPSAGTESK